MNCPNCGAANPEGSLFCGECGVPIEEKTPGPEARAVPVAAEGVVRCGNCGAENTAGAVFCSACRSVLDAPLAGDGTAGSVPSELEPRSEQAAVPAPVGHPHAQLPKRCPSCGGPIYPELIRCSRCGASVLTLAALERQFSPVDADGHDLADVSGWDLSGLPFRDLVPRRFRPVYDVIDFILQLLAAIVRLFLSR